MDPKTWGATAHMVMQGLWQHKSESGELSKVPNKFIQQNLICAAYFWIEKLLRPCWSCLVYSLTRALVSPVPQLQALLASSIRG